MKNHKGFTLIEMIIVVAIIGVLMSIAMPAYQSYLKRTMTNSCLYEVKGYSNMVFVSLFDSDEETHPLQPFVSACDSITDASLWTVSTIGIIEAKAKYPSYATIYCDITKGGGCTISP